MAPGALLLGEAASPDWHLRVDGRAAPRVRAFGWANAFLVSRGGHGVLRYRTPPYRLVLVAVEAALWIAAIRALARRRRRAR